MLETASRAGMANHAKEKLVAQIMAVPAALALLVAIADFVRRGSGIAWTTGTGLAIFGCAALVFAALMIARLHPGVLRTIFVILALIGGVLTALAAWFLESPLVLTGMLVMLACWLLFVLVAR